MCLEPLYIYIYIVCSVCFVVEALFYFSFLYFFITYFLRLFHVCVCSVFVIEAFSFHFCISLLVIFSDCFVCVCFDLEYI